MKKYFFMGLGCATGIAVVFIIFVAITYFSFSGGGSKEIRYFDVTTTKGTFNLHLYMPKDSVIMLLGQPDDKRMHTMAGDIMETLEYNKANSDKLRLNFTNGSLEDVMEY